MARINWKIILAVAVLIFILIVVLIFISLPKNSNPISVSPSPIPSATPATSWKMHQESGYQISVPSEITVVPTNIQGGGKGLLFQPQKGLKYNLELQVVPNTLASVQKITAIFELQQYTETVVYINGITGKKFSGSMKIGNQLLQGSAVVFERGGDVYKFQLGYLAPTRNTEIDNLFSQLIATFRFNQ